MDSVSKSKRSEIMRLIKSSETSLEKPFRSLLWKSGVRYRKNNPKLLGKPDISIANKKIVIFIDSCFWHGCSKHIRLPKSNVNYWINKIKKNKKRDALITRYYKNKKWKIVRIWEHQLKQDSEELLSEVMRSLGIHR